MLGHSLQKSHGLKEEHDMGRIITPDDPRFPQPTVRFEGLFAGRAIDYKGRVKRSFGFIVPNKNLIVDLGLDRLGGYGGAAGLGVSSGFMYMLLGTSTTPPTVNDTAMASFGVNVASPGVTQRLSGNSGAPDYYGWCRGRWTSAIGGATGNWTNIAISSSATNAANSLRSSALIVDNGGNPTTFPVLADEQFEGYWELRAYVNLADTTYTINVGSTSTNCTQRPSYVQGNQVPSSLIGDYSAFSWLDGGAIRSTGVLGPITGGMTGLIVDGHYPVFQVSGPYTPGSYEQLYAASSGPTQAVGTFKGISRQANSGIGFQTLFDPPITKNNTESLTYYQKFTWARR